MKRVEFNAVEFDWVFKGQLARDFIEHLASTENDSLFGNPTIRIIVLFLWGKFFYNIRNKIFYPFIFYFLVFVTLATIIYDKKIHIKDYLDGKELSDVKDFDHSDYTEKHLR